MAIIHVFLALEEGEALPTVEAVLISRDEADGAVRGSTVKVHWDTGSGYADLDPKPVEPVIDPEDPESAEGGEGEAEAPAEGTSPPA